MKADVVHGAFHAKRNSSLNTQTMLSGVNRINSQDPRSNMQNAGAQIMNFAPSLNDPSLVSNDYQMRSLALPDERVSGYPQPELYDQYYINTYAYPKGLKSQRRDKSPVPHKKSLYDMKAPSQRKGFSGWKLTMTKGQQEQQEQLM